MIILMYITYNTQSHKHIHLIKGTEKNTSHGFGKWVFHNNLGLMCFVLFFLFLAPNPHFL